MQKVLFMMIATSFCLLSWRASAETSQTVNKKAKWTLAQNDEADDFFDDEGGEVFDDEGELDPPGAQESVARPKPNRFRNRRGDGRFNRNRNNNTGSVLCRSKGPTTPVKEIKVKKVDAPKKKKLTFATAEPEDITDENFPDIIESFDYPNASIMDVANAISKLTKKNFIIESGVSGKITIVAPTPVTVAQAWKLFLSALAMNNYTVVPTGNGYLKIRKESNAKNDSI